MIPEPKKAIDNWKGCDINQLAHHFHRLGATQFERKRSFRFVIPEGESSDFKIHMTLKDLISKTTDFTFQPLLEKGNGAYIAPIQDENVAKQDSGNLGNAARVPMAYLDTVAHNWQLLNQSLIDDAFLAEHSDRPGANAGMLRLMNYVISSKVNSELYEFIKNNTKSAALEMTFHLGIDFNKRPENGEYPFAPVLEFKIKSRINELNEFEKFVKYRGLILGGSVGDDTTVYFQYMRPCPSTCPPE